MFKIVEKPRAWWPVVWPGVTEEGAIVDNKIEMRFLLHKVDAAIGIMRQAHEVGAKAQVEQDNGEELKASKLYAEAVQLFACDWRDVALENGELLRWSADNLAMLMNEPRLFDAVMAAYGECMGAGRKITEGN